MHEKEGIKNNKIQKGKWLDKLTCGRLKLTVIVVFENLLDVTGFQISFLLFVMFDIYKC